ncbi:MAG TPA: SDR family NAD(P)-dependent oxidoreductase [Dehalococcoidia bacterium]|jgi:citronellol/citronellal dehydrogenase|nr:SDR family NAD(P)-dependent oxidoreductase [Dehalococcoidia bacterium]
MAPEVNKNGLLAGKVAVVTGASRGIGESIAIRYAMEGAKVVVSARTLDEGDHPLPGSINGVVALINDAGGEALAVQCNLANSDERESLIEQTEAAFGPVDILVNNAAITYFIPLEAFPEKREKLMFEVQVFASVHLSQLVLPGMKEKGAGAILNISSHAALHPALPSDGGEGGGGTVYGMCKAAVERFSTGLAAETHAAGISVNAISPGLVATPGVLLHGLVTEKNKDSVTPVENMAEACLRLCHSDPEPISGRITYAADMIEEYKLEVAELLA